MAKVTLPSKDYLRQCLDYDPETGVLTWKTRPVEHFKNESYQKRFNARWAGKRAGSQRKPKASAHANHFELAITCPDGTCQNYLAHRVIWKWAYGTEPVEIDHRDIDGGNNRLKNLRACEHHQNMSNTKLRRDNKSGFKGVYLRPSGRWSAEISHRGEIIRLGRFDTAEQAAAAYAQQSRQLHGEYAGELKRA